MHLVRVNNYSKAHITHFENCHTVLINNSNIHITTTYLQYLYYIIIYK